MICMREFKKTKLDEQIKETPRYIKVLKKVVARMFELNFKELDASRIYVDINSCLSVIFREDNYNNEDNIQEMNNILNTFLNEALINKKEVVFMFTTEPSQAHIDIYPDWCKERYSRVKILRSTFLKRFLMAVKTYSDKYSSVKVVNTTKVHPALIVYNTEKSRRKPFLILSKDLVFQTMPIERCSIYTGISYIDMSNPNRDLPDLINIPEPTEMLPYAISLIGSSREEFPGLNGYGPRKAEKYVSRHKLDIQLGINHELKEHMDKYEVLFDIPKLLACNKEELAII